MPELVLCLLGLALLASAVSATEPPAAVRESARAIPVAYDVDVVVVGGSTGAVSAAVAAAEKGAKVFLAAPRPYLGEDLCATLRLWLEEGETPASPLAKKLFAADARLATPLHVKRTLDQALLAAKVEFLTGCYVSDILRDAQGHPAGVVIANRAGRQAVLAKTIIDATDRAWIARMAGAKAGPWPAGPQVFRRVVIGGEPVQGEGVEVRRTGLAFPSGPRTYEIYEYALKIPMPSGSQAEFAKAEQIARDRTFHLGQVDASERLLQVPPDPVKGSGADGLAAYRPAGLARMLVLGPCADVPREEAARLLRPLALMDLGAKIGAAAADEAKSAPAAKDVKVAGLPSKEPAAAGDTKEPLAGLRPGAKVERTVPAPERALPVLGRYDVVVIGGGTAGAPAAIGASRGGAKTLLVEYLNGLGGVETMGMIIKYYYGYRGGFTAEVDKGIQALGAANDVVGKAEWWRQENRRAGAEIWFGAMGVGAFVEGGVVRGAVVVTPEGRGVVLAKTVIDSTGNADVAAAAGAATVTTGGDDVGVQGAGLPPLNLGASYTNTDWTFADDTDVVDSWHHFVIAREKYKTAYDVGQLVDTRERRRIVGDVTVTPMDIVLNRTWPDAVVQSSSNFDSHGFTVHPLFFAMPPGHEAMTVFVPWRALLPKGLDGILVTGLGISAHRDAMPVIRMQPDVQNQGYACGTAAAMVAHSSSTIRTADLRALQEHLVKVGCLPEKVLTQKDSLPLAKDEVARAVADVASPARDVPGKAPGADVLARRRALAVVFAQPQDSVPLMEAAYAAAKEADARVAYAEVLAMMGSKAGADALLEKVKAAKQFDKGWNYTGMGQFGMSVSELDACIIALGRTRDPRALGAILEKMALLDATKEFSHHRACAMALETLGDPKAAKPLADLLAKPKMTGYATTTVDEAKRLTGPNPEETKPRNDSLRELILARALFRCGDSDGIGRKILETYAKDLRGHYARHARAVLDGK